jgi:hypothetical protein
MAGIHTSGLHMTPSMGLRSPIPHSLRSEHRHVADGGTLFVRTRLQSIRQITSLVALSIPIKPVKRWGSSVVATVAIAVVNGMTDGAVSANPIK